MIIIDSRVRQLLIDDALNTFPDECCGFMFGREESDGTRIVVDILVVDNSKAGDKTRRFVISPLDYMTAEQHALDHDWTLLGIYHSHPKHPAIPSEHDRVAAQPYFSYVIISVMEAPAESAIGGATRSTTSGEPSKSATVEPSAQLTTESINLRSWLLNEESQFEEEKIIDFQFT